MKKTFPLPGFCVVMTLMMSGCSMSLRPSDSVDIAFDAGKRYLLIPIEDRAPELEMYIVQNGATVTPRMNIRLASSEISYWVPVSLDRFTDGDIALRIAGLDKSNGYLDSIETSDDFYFEKGEKFRPHYHFAPKYGWMNDPNGMVYHNGEYHLFYQHNPYGSVWGNMHWGHAVSKDLKKWEHLPVAIAPDSLGTIFSGSAVIDRDNSAGFGENALVAIYTSAGERQQQSIAYSRDGGRTFTKYAANPVLANDSLPDFRDPKVFWHDATSRWVMTLATGQTVSFYSSPDLKQWDKLSDFGEGIGAHGGVWECPDLFSLNWNGDTKWVLIVNINPGGPNGGSAAQYFIGDFDGCKFTPDPLPYPLWLDYGRDNYAGVTWSGAPGDRRIFIGWMSNWEYANAVPTVHFKSANTLPRELKLVHNGRHLIVANPPVEELDSLRGETTPFPGMTVDGSRTIEKLPAGNNGAYEIEMTIGRGRSWRFGFRLSNRANEELAFEFDLESGTLNIDRSKSGNTGFSERFSAERIVAPLGERSTYRIRLFIDKASSELFLNDGELVSTNIVFPSEPYNVLTFESDDKIFIENLFVHSIK
ncbi:MAG: GH32 C-terminal domain-containing protein [Alistipes sp.]|jgi:fructan beta-fructosidase|nr:GH32 C-terminal domain-containing protein [Alistipes sp.]